jgi:hypothetical protein
LNTCSAWPPSETGIKHKTLPIQEKPKIINKVGYYFRLLLDKEGIALDGGVSVSHVNRVVTR